MSKDFRGATQILVPRSFNQIPVGCRSITSHPCYAMFFYQRMRFGRRRGRRGRLCLKQAPSGVSQDIRCATSPSVFRRRLKTHLFDNAYNC